MERRLPWVMAVIITLASWYLVLWIVKEIVS